MTNKEFIEVISLAKEIDNLESELASIEKLISMHEEVEDTENVARDNDVIMQSINKKEIIKTALYEILTEAIDEAFSLGYNLGCESRYKDEKLSELNKTNKGMMNI